MKILWTSGFVSVVICGTLKNLRKNLQRLSRLDVSQYLAPKDLPRLRCLRWGSPGRCSSCRDLPSCKPHSKIIKNHAPPKSSCTKIQQDWISVMSWDVYYGSLKYPKNFYCGSWGKDHHGRGRSIWWQALQQECEHVHPILDEGIRHLRHQKQSCTQYWKLNDTTCSVILTSSRVVVQLYHCRKPVQWYTCRVGINIHSNW